MRLLFDQNISFKICRLISDVFVECTHVRHQEIENFSDKKIWEFARENQFAIVTFDGDFYDFSIVWGHPPKIIWLRTLDQTTRNVERILRSYEEDIRVFEDDPNIACLVIIQH